MEGIGAESRATAISDVNLRKVDNVKEKIVRLAASKQQPYILVVDRRNFFLSKQRRRRIIEFTTAGKEDIVVQREARFSAT